MRGSAETPRNEPSVFDPDRLRALVGSDPETLVELLGAYFESCEYAAAELDAALHARQPERIALFSHRLKASSLCVGALTLGELCGQIEMHAGSTTATDWTGLRAQFAEHSQAALHWISDQLIATRELATVAAQGKGKHSVKE